MKVFGGDDEPDDVAAARDELDETLADDDLDVDPADLPDEVVDALPDSLTTRDDERWDVPGSLVGRRVARLAMNLSKPLPLATRFWKAVAATGLRAMEASSDADALVLNFESNGRVDIEPMARYADPDDHSEGDLWHTPDWQRQWVGSGGDDIVRGPKNTNIAVAAGDEYHLGNHLMLRANTALDLGDDAHLYADPTIMVKEDVERQIMVDGDAAAEGAAVADGGQLNQAAITDIEDRVVGRSLDVQDLSWLGDDHVIDLERTDNRLLSVERAYDAMPERMAAEEHQAAEERGRLSEEDQDKQAFVLKLMLIAAAIVLGTLAIMFIGVPAVQGSGGGGGGVTDVPLQLAMTIAGWP